MKRIIDISVLIGSIILLIVLIFNNEDNKYSNITSLADTTNKNVILAHLKSAGFQAHPIQVSVKDHDVMLTGIVDNLAEKEEIATIVQSTDAAHIIKNSLLIKYNPYNDLQMASKVTKALITSPTFDIFDWVDVKVTNGIATLNGVVRDPSHKEYYRQLVTNINGVKAINNNIRELPLSLDDERLRFETAKVIYGNPMLIQYTNNMLPQLHIIVENGMIQLKGVRPNRWDQQMITTNIGEAENDLTINSDIISLNGNE